MVQKLDAYQYETIHLDIVEPYSKDLNDIDLLYDESSLLLKGDYVLNGYVWFALETKKIGITGVTLICPKRRVTHHIIINVQNG